MDPVSVIGFPGLWGVVVAIVTALFAGGGFWAFLAARSRSKAADTKAATADWQAFNTYWQSELAAVKLRLAMIEQWHLMDEQHINVLEAHIWAGNPPPPPPRPTYPSFTPPPEEA